MCEQRDVTATSVGWRPLALHGSSDWSLEHPLTTDMAFVKTELACFPEALVNVQDQFAILTVGAVTVKSKSWVVRSGLAGWDPRLPVGQDCHFLKCPWTSCECPDPVCAGM